jgi:short subunit dehydrogenase-like uncharacterized protein
MAIALYGATGYTGRLVTDELVRRGVDFVLGGRNAEKLRRLADERGRGAAIRTASIDDPASLRALLDGCDVVINCAGPFSLAGEAVVDAAAETGTHYVDSTGEQTYMRAVFERYGPKAERKGVALVPALGFDYVPGDCIARIAARGHEPLEELELAYAVKGFGASRGTLSSALEMMKGGDVTYDEGGWRPAPRVVPPRHFDFPAPIGRKALAKYPSGEVITVPRHTRTRRVTSGIVAEAFAPIAALAPAVPYFMPGIALALRTPLRRLVGEVVGRLPEGPPEDERRAAEFTVVAVARGADGSVGRGVVRGRDPYGLTAVTLVHGGELMSSEGYGESGALGPAAAYDPEAFLNYLGDHGVSWELGGN